MQSYAKKIIEYFTILLSHALSLHSCKAQITILFNDINGDKRKKVMNVNKY